MNVDRSSVEREWSARGFTCGLWVDPPGRIWRDYRHVKDELFMVVEGEVELELEGRPMRPRAGEEVLIPANTRHTVRNIGETMSRWLYGYKH